MQIKDKVIRLDKIYWNLLHDLQDPDFKEAKHKERVKQSIIDNGIASAVHVWLNKADNKTYIVDGHTRKDALQELHSEGYSIDSTLPCLFLDLQDKAEAAKVLLAFNAKTAKINQDALPSFLETYEITLEDARIEIEELHLTTFDDDLDITTLEDDIGENDCDVEPPRTPITAKGDLYELNGHRVLCGDSTVIDDIDKLMQEERADLVFTDPPYSMHLDTDFSSMKNEFKGKQQGNTYSKVIGDNDDFTPELINTIFANFDYCKEIFIWGSDYFAELLPEKNKGSWIVWDKRLTDEAGKMYGSEFELCWSKSKHKRKIFRVKWAGIFGTETQDIKHRVHPTQKPLELILLFLQEWSKENCLVVDLFGGSGSTLIACEQSKRKNYSIELEPKYCDVIVRRWTKYMQDNNKEFTVKRNGETLQQHEIGKYLN